MMLELADFENGLGLLPMSLLVACACLMLVREKMAGYLNGRPLMKLRRPENTTFGQHIVSQQCCRLLAF